jgi:hypothetical protein
MKKLLLIALVLLSLSSSAQVKIKSFIEAGYENRTIAINDNGFYNFQKSCFSTYNITSQYKNFSLHSTNKVYFRPLRLFGYNPHQIEFYIGAKYTYKSIDIKYEHLCSHGIENNTFYDTYDRISIQLKIF